MGSSKSRNLAIAKHSASIDEPKYINLADGRRLAYEQYGDDKGEKDVIFFHGDPGSRLFFPFHESSKNKGIRVWVLERPGFGSSSAHIDRDFQTNTRDVEEFLENFNLKNVIFVGYSAGGPYALSAASKIQCESCIIISSLAPPTVPKAWKQMSYVGCIGWLCVSSCPCCIPLLVCLDDCGNSDCCKCSKYNPEKAIYDSFEQIYDSVDMGDIKDNELVKSQFITSMLENESSSSYHQTKTRELQLFGTDWEPILKGISCPVFQYNGALDKGCVPKFAEYLQEKIPTCITKTVPDRGHLAFFYIWDEIMENILQSRF